MTIPSSNPLAYQGVKAPNPANVIRAQRNPTAADINHDLGTIWINEVAQEGFALTGVPANAAVWEPFAGGTGTVNTINSLSPTGGNITLAGTGDQISVANAGSTVTFSMPAAIVTPGSLTTTTSLGATTTVTAGTGITSTTGDITATAGSLIAGTGVTSPLYTAPLATDLALNAAAGQDIDVQLGDAAGANNISFFSSTPGLLTSLDSLGTFTSLGDMITSRSAAAVNVTHQITNSDNTDGTSNARLELATGGASSGDAGVLFQVSGVATNWFAGLDNSDTDAWVLSASATAGTNNAIRIDHATQNIQILQNLDVVVGNITATNGNLIATVGSVSLPGDGSRLQVKGGAATDFIGTATLAAGTVTIAHTGITAADRIMVTRSSINGSSALGVFEVVKNAGADFVINARNPADATIQTNDVSIVEYVITRQLA